MIYDRYLFTLYVCLVIDGICLVISVRDYINNLFGCLFVNDLFNVYLMFIVVIVLLNLVVLCVGVCYT